MKDSKSILLALLSIGLVGTWFFHFYEKSRYTTAKESTYIKDSAVIAQIIAEAVKGSVQKINNPDTTLKSSNDLYIDSLKRLLDSSVNEVINLKKEIDDILKNDKATQTDLARSRQLINELNKKTDKLNSENKLLGSQKVRSNTNQQNSNEKSNDLIANTKKTNHSKKDSIFLVSDISLTAVATQAEDKEKVAASANEADKLVFSFTLRNNILDDSYYDVYIVIIGPGNKVLQADEWAAAENFFVSKTEGKRPFTKRIRFEYNQGNPKKIAASIVPEKIAKGTYTLKIYYNGVVIGQTRRSIS